jgi:hypothetical protein
MDALDSKNDCAVRQLRNPPPVGGAHSAGPRCASAKGPDLPHGCASPCGKIPHRAASPRDRWTATDGHATDGQCARQADRPFRHATGPRQDRDRWTGPRQVDRPFPRRDRWTDIDRRTDLLALRDSLGVLWLLVSAAGCGQAVSGTRQMYTASCGQAVSGTRQMYMPCREIDKCREMDRPSAGATERQMDRSR